MTLLPEIKTLLVIKAVAFFPVLFGDFVKIIFSERRHPAFKKLIVVETCLEMYFVPVKRRS
jgi:hypothetical protein